VNAWCRRYATGTWAYDTTFNDVADLPPNTPLAVTTVDVAVE
jgi:hypothetical protein